jgi:hypothetical protein
MFSRRYEQDKDDKSHRYFKVVGARRLGSGKTADGEFCTVHHYRSILIARAGHDSTASSINSASASETSSVCS